MDGRISCTPTILIIHFGILITRLNRLFVHILNIYYQNSRDQLLTQFKFETLPILKCTMLL